MILTHNKEKSSREVLLQKASVILKESTKPGKKDSRLKKLQLISKRINNVFSKERRNKVAK